MTRSEAGRLGRHSEKFKKYLSDFRAARLSEYKKEPILCKYCNVDLIESLKPGQKLPSLKHRSFCNNSCSASYCNGRREIRGRACCRAVCEYCQLPCKNKYCNIDCQKAARYQKKLQVWRETGFIPPNTLRKYLFKLNNNSCSQCGWNLVNSVTGKCILEIDHIDGNCENNEESNVRLLCPNCHSLTPTYKALNKGSGRASRRLRYQKEKLLSHHAI